MVSLTRHIAGLHRLSKKPASHFHETLLLNIRHIVFVKDKELRVVYANPAFLELYPPEQRGSIIGSLSADGFSEEEAAVFLAEDRKALETGFTEIVEEITDYTGRHRIFQTQKIRFYDDATGEPRVLGIGTDITRLAEREKQLARSNLSLENFAALAAHDLRSPLGSIYSSLDLIHNDKKNKLSAASRKHMDLIANCLEGLMSQVTALLETCKAANLKSGQSFTECDLSTVFEEVRFNLSTRIAENRAKVLSTELPKMKVNKPLFRQLLHNLVENSLKYRSDATPIIILRHSLDRNTHRFCIEDNGRGIDPAKHRKVFDLYKQENEKSEGYGIGLSLCRNIVETHGGKIWIDDGFTKGSRICFEIPELPPRPPGVSTN